MFSSVFYALNSTRLSSYDFFPAWFFPLFARSLSSTLLTAAITDVLKPLFLRCVTPTAQNRSIEYLHSFACVCMSPAGVHSGVCLMDRTKTRLQNAFSRVARVYSFREKSFWGIQGAIGLSGPCKYSFLRVCSTMTCLFHGCAPR